MAIFDEFEAKDELWQSLELQTVYPRVLSLPVFASFLLFISHNHSIIYILVSQALPYYIMVHTSFCFYFFLLAMLKPFLKYLSSPFPFKLKIRLDDSCKMKKEAVLSNGKMNKLGIWKSGFWFWHYPLCMSLGASVFLSLSFLICKTWIVTLVPLTSLVVVNKWGRCESSVKTYYINVTCYYYHSYFYKLLALHF